MAIVTKVSDIQNLGDKIPCRYTTLVSGQIGSFKEFGTTISTSIPVASSAIPDGSFNWIYVGKDYLGRMKFIADRNVQHSISWNKLNATGIASGEGLNINKLTSSCIPNFGTANTFSFNEITYVTSCSSRYNASYEPYNCFNKGTSSGEWATANPSNGGWVSIDLGLNNSKEILGYSVMGTTGATGASGGATAPKNWTLEGSNDNSTWDIIDTQTSQTGWSNTLTRTYMLPNKSSGYRYFRIHITANNGNVSFLTLGELDFIVLNEPLFGNGFISSIRLLNGGISTTDTDNEWDKIIVNSTLNDTITSGDNNVWNWSGISSWTSSTGTTSANKVIRGNTTVGTTNAPTGLVTTTVNTTTGFRPVLLVETKPLYLIKQNSNYYTINNDYYDSSTSHNFNILSLTSGTTVPNKSDIETFGFTDLNILTNSMTVGSDTFVPISKFDNQFEIKMYKG